MKKILLFFTSSVAISFLSCSCSTDKFAHEIKFYRRDFGGDESGTLYYYDFLSISNYEDKTITVKELFDIAKHYIDTVKSDKPVTDVTFLGQRNNNELPKPSFNNSISEYELISFGFTRDSLSHTNKFSNIGLHIYGKQISLWNKIPQEKEKMDSLLNSKKPFENGF